MLIGFYRRKESTYFPVITGLRVKYIIELFSTAFSRSPNPTYPIRPVSLYLPHFSYPNFAICDIIDHLLASATIDESHGSKYLITPRQIDDIMWPRAPVALPPFPLTPLTTIIYRRFSASPPFCTEIYLFQHAAAKTRLLHPSRRPQFILQR